MFDHRDALAETSSWKINDISNILLVAEGNLVVIQERIAVSLMIAGIRSIGCIMVRKVIPKDFDFLERLGIIYLSMSM